MAVDSYDSVTGRPIFLDSGAPDTGVDPTEVGKYAADVGNRIVRASLAGLNAYTYKRKGLLGHALDTGREYLHDGSGWRPLTGVVIPSSIANGGGSASIGADGTVSFSGVTSISLNDVFDGVGSDMYDVWAQIKQSGNGYVELRLRSNGADHTTANYNRVGVQNTIVGGPTRTAASPSGIMAYLQNQTVNPNSDIAAQMRFTTPFGADCHVRVQSVFAGIERTMWDEYGQGPGTDKDGFTVYTTSGTMAGKLKVVKI